MYGSIKTIEFNNNEIRSISHTLGPHVKGQLRGLTFGIRQEVDKIIRMIESEIGVVE